MKVLSLVSECELSTTDGRQIVSQLEIRNSVKFLIEQQNKDGSFADPNPVIHREMQVWKFIFDYISFALHYMRKDMHKIFQVQALC